MRSTVIITDGDASSFKEQLDIKKKYLKMLIQNEFYTGKSTQWGKKVTTSPFPLGNAGSSAREREEPDTQAKCLNRFFYDCVSARSFLLHSFILQILYSFYQQTKSSFKPPRMIP